MGRGARALTRLPVERLQHLISAKTAPLRAPRDVFGTKGGAMRSLNTPLTEEDKKNAPLGIESLGAVSPRFWDVA